MTYSITNRENENAGSLAAVFVTVDITSLDSAGFEPFDPAAALGVDGASEYGVVVRGIEDPTYRVEWDHVNGQLDVTNAADGTDVAAATDVGEVVIEVKGT